ncbi:PD40 domain-containing protein [Pelagicoccus sp. NFK12]|uniref:PD40 domain-containing protein n=1 Tax=Pelagicoccus enzymogenes TaxID=2773457 RepID=A0A927F8D8_9BACT|nr:PD40 domain-containing protein [Pelagicoccus enzymogenes]MBD5780353.1 PD40 domain-containing protein [Pelagicoccus enzymogenes]
MKHPLLPTIAVAACLMAAQLFAASPIGTRLPSEKKIISDPVTGVELAFLTSKQSGDSKIYQTHPQWTSDGEWLVFRSDRIPGEALAVNEATGDIVQVTEGGYFGMLTLARKSMKLYVMRDPELPATEQPRYGRGDADKAIVEVDLQSLFADSAAGTLKPADRYQRIVGKVPGDMGAGGDMAIDANEDVIYFRVGREEAAKHLDPSVEIAENFGPRNMGAGPTGIASMHIPTGKIEFVAAAPFQMGHIQTNPWVSGELVFCWETGGKSPQRLWTVKVGGEIEALYPEAEYEWVTHEAIISPDEVAIAIMGHNKVGTDGDWGPSGTREKPTGLGIVNLRTREMRIAGQTRSGSGLWHVHGSADGRWAVGDDFSRSLYLIDRKTDEMMLLTTGHKPSARDHVHPTFSPDGTKIQIQSAMLSEDDRSMNICIVYLPDSLLDRDYSGVLRKD